MKDHKFIKYLRATKEDVWPLMQDALEGLLDFEKCCQIDSKYSSLAKFHKKMVNDYPQRQGKYLRPSLVLLICEALKGSKEKVLNTALAMQLSEEWLLIHDDIEDNGEQRRGSPALHNLYGKDLAINAGDALHVLMWKVLRNNYEILDKNTADRIMDEFTQMLSRTIFGQTAELKWAQEENREPTLEDVLYIIDGKTSYYSIAGPMRLGAIVAGADDFQLEKLYKFGQLMGRAFQIKDDLLDLTSDFGGLKNQLSSDIYESKKTVFLVHLLENIKKENKSKLLGILQKSSKEKSINEVEWVIENMRQSGSLDYGEKLARQYSRKALAFLDTELDFISSAGKQNLTDAIDFLVERDH